MCFGCETHVRPAWAQQSRRTGLRGACVQGFPDCKTVPYRCNPDKADDAIYAFLITSLFVYWIGTAYLLRRSFIYLRTKPYNQMRMANQHLRINVRLCSCSPTLAP